MTLTRLMVAFLIVVLIADHQFGEGRLARSASTQALDLAYRLNDAVAHLIHKVTA
jgi:hypothetical protein